MQSPLEWFKPTTDNSTTEASSKAVSGVTGNPEAEKNVGS